MNHSARLGADLSDGRAGGVVHEDVELVEVRHRRLEVRHLGIAELARAHAGHIHHGLRAHEALGDLLAGHLQGEEADGVTGDGGVQREVQGEGGLADGGPRADDDELAFAQS